MFLMIIAGIPLLSAAWWIWAHRRLRALGVSRRVAWLLGLPMVVLLGTFGWIILDRSGNVSRPPAPFYAAVLLWGLMFLPLLALPSMLGWGVVAAVRRALGWLAVNPRPADEASSAQPVAAAIPAPGMTRREVLAAGVVALPVFATFGTTAFSLPQVRRFQIRQLSVALRGLPPALDGMTIAHLSDSHVGKFTHGRVLEEIAAATNRLEADLVLFTGDLLDTSLDDLPAAMTMLNAIDPRSGLVLIEGNHDLFQGAENFARGVRAYGHNLLRDEALTVRVRGVPVQLLGIRWHGRQGNIQPHVDKVAALRQPDAFPILLAHHPDAFDRASELGLPLTLAGHTHGGQVMLTPEFGAGSMIFKYLSGHYQRAGSSLVVNNGVGNWFPLRTCAPAEIIHLTLRCAG